MAVAVMASAMDDECNGEWGFSYKSVQPLQHSGSFPIGVRKKQDLGSSFNNNAMLCALRLSVKKISHQCYQHYLVLNPVAGGCHGTLKA